MPTYEYVCDKCEGEFEQFQPIADKPLTVCPREACCLKTWGKGKVRRKISAGAGLLFKGSGFYITDYRSEGYKQAAKKEKESSTPSAEAKSSSDKPAGSASKPAKQETKPAKKT